ISSLQLPLIVEMEDGALAIVNALADDQAVVAPATTPAAERRMPVAALIDQARRIVHARAASQMADERVDAYVRPHQPNWLWRILTLDLKPYGYVLLASLVSNSLALAGIIFSMQVYDRVIPAESIPT